MPTIDFWHEFASTYSYLAALRVERLARSVGVEIRWRPFLLGPVFAAHGWNTSPFNLYPAKGGYMWRDLERHAGAMGIEIRKPDPFPQNGLLAARVALLGHAGAWGPAFTKAVYHVQFAEGRQIGDAAVIAEILTTLGQEPEVVLASAQADGNKARLRSETEQALRLGIFGAPSFITEDGELFWGNDRLEEALYWAKHGSLEGFVARPSAPA